MLLLDLIQTLPINNHDNRHLLQYSHNIEIFYTTRMIYSQKVSMSVQSLSQVMERNIEN